MIEYFKIMLLPLEATVFSFEQKKSETVEAEKAHSVAVAHIDNVVFRSSTTLGGIIETLTADKLAVNDFNYNCTYN